jgi:hypothetical protein
MLKKQLFLLGLLGLLLAAAALLGPNLTQQAEAKATKVEQCPNVTCLGGMTNCIYMEDWKCWMQNGTCFQSGGCYET